MTLYPGAWAARLIAVDNQRLLLWASFGMVLFLIYQAWIEDYAPAPAARGAATETRAAESFSDDLSDLPRIETAPAETPPTLAEAPDIGGGGERIKVLSDVLDLRIDTEGGALVYAALPRYPREKTRPDDPVVLLDTSDEFFVTQTGLRAADGSAEPNHRASWLAEKTEYRLAEGEDELLVILRWTSDSLRATKTYRLKRGSYRVDIETRLTNQGAAAWSGADYIQLLRDHREIKRSFTSVDSYSYLGPAVYDGEKYEKYDAQDLAATPWRVTAEGGWLALLQHHFLVAVVPPPAKPYQLEARLLDNDRFLLRAVGPTQSVAPGETGVFSNTVFVGPKLHKQLVAVAPKLDLTVDYGLTTIIAQPLFWILNKIHSVVGNWGWSIILLTLLIKIVFYKLAETSGRSMAKMRKLQPRMKALQERYKDDRQKLSQAMMELYKQEKANPAAGCLPLLVQMPVFFALYWTLIESVELRQAPWMLWVNDLSSRDPLFILPVLMGISMFAMQKLNPQPTDPVQAKVMLFMPLMMGAFMAFFPSGLVLYWLVNNLLSIAQQWRINKVVEAER